MEGSSSLGVGAVTALTEGCLGTRRSLVKQKSSETKVLTRSAEAGPRAGAGPGPPTPELGLSRAGIDPSRGDPRIPTPTRRKRVSRFRLWAAGQGRGGRGQGGGKGLFIFNALGPRLACVLRADVWRKKSTYK